MSPLEATGADPSVRRGVGVGLRLIALLLLLAALWQVREVLMLSFLAVLIAVVFSFPVGWLERHTGRGAAVLLTLLLLGGGLGTLAWAATPVLTEQGRALVRNAPEAMRSARGWLEHARRTVDPKQRLSTPAPPGAPAVPVEKAAELAFPAALSLAETVTELVLTLVLAAFLVHQPRVYVRGVRRLVPRRHEATFDEACRRLLLALRQWVGGILMAMLLMGLLTGAGLAAVGIENWFLLGFLTFLATFVPYVGAVASAIPGLLAGLTQSVHHFLLAGAVYLGVHVVEGYIVEPFVMRRAVKVRPALLLFGQALFTALFGVLGAVIATPLLVCLQVLVGFLYVERRLGKQAPQLPPDGTAAPLSEGAALQ